MSGGYFEHQQYALGFIADSIEQVIRDWENQRKSEYEDRIKWDFQNPSTILELYNAMNCLRKAEIYAQRVDWLLSDDDGEESFHQRLKEDFRDMKEYKSNGNSSIE